METIYKKISLEDFTSRNNGVIPSYLNGEYTDIEQLGGMYSDYGRMPMDVIVSGNGGATDFTSIYPNLSAYEDLEGIYRDLSVFEGKLPISDADGVKVLRYKNMLTYYKYIKDFYKECEIYILCLKKGENYWRRVYTKSINEFFSLEITDFISRDADTSSYKKGDIICVHDDSDKYKMLFYSNGVRLDKAFYFLSEEIINTESKDNSIFTIPYMNVSVYIENDIDNLGYDTPACEEWIANKHYHYGETVFYDGKAWVMKDRNGGGTFFTTDDYIPKFDYSKWERSCDNETVETNDIIKVGCDKGVIGDFMRSKMTYNTDGVKLNYIYNMDNGNIELPFKRGICNYDFARGVADKFISAKLYVNDKLIENGIKEGDGVFILQKGLHSLGEYLEFEFVYVKDMIIGDDGSPIEDSGMRYTERYIAEPCSDYVYGKEDNKVYVDGFKFVSTVSCSVEYGKEMYAKGEFEVFPTIKYETTIGSCDLYEDVDVNVRRGSYSAFEKHSILGEINTLEDLEEYKNGMFNAAKNQ